MSDFWTKAKGVFKKSMIWLGVVIIAGATLYVVFIRYTAYSNGYRAGQITKFSRKGVVFKTFEGEMNLGGFRDNEQGEITPTIWPFSVYKGSDEIQDQIVKSMENGRKVRLHYKERYAKLFWFGDTKYFIDKVEIVE